jgi:membrane fusion protein, multidrug efflux system
MPCCAIDLRYCDVVAEIDGVVARRNVNPGETFRSARVSSRSDRRATSGSTRISRKRNCATCESASRLISISTCMVTVMCSKDASPGSRSGPDRRWRCCAERRWQLRQSRARLPVRIELENFDPEKSPLFIGTSVVPYVYINRPPTGPDAFLQAYLPQSAISRSAPSLPSVEK